MANQTNSNGSGTPKGVGVMIAALTGIAAVGITAISAKGCVDNQPKVWVDGVGMHSPMAEQAVTATKTWPHLGAEVAAMHRVLQAKFPSADIVLRDHLWLEVHPMTATITSALLPTGHVQGADGKLHPASGTMDATPMQFAFFGPKNYIAKVRALPGGACASAFSHEVAQHIVPFMLEGDLNFWHEGTTLPPGTPADDRRRIPKEKQRWIPLDLEMAAACRELAK